MSGSRITCFYTPSSGENWKFTGSSKDSNDDKLSSIQRILYDNDFCSTGICDITSTNTSINEFLSKFWDEASSNEDIKQELALKLNRNIEESSIITSIERVDDSRHHAIDNISVRIIHESIINQEPIWSISEKYGIPSGQVICLIKKFERNMKAVHRSNKRWLNKNKKITNEDIAVVKDYIQRMLGRRITLEGVRGDLLK